MNWINNVVRPKIRGLLNKREVPENLWIKCPETGEMVFHRDLEANQFVIPGSGYHMRMTPKQRLEHFFDGGEWETDAAPRRAARPAEIPRRAPLHRPAQDARAKTGLADAVLVGAGTLEGLPVVAAVQDFDFMGGSLGMAAGEAIITGLQTRRASASCPSSSSPPRAAPACRRASSR